MNTLVKVGLSAGVGTFAAGYLEPHLAKLVNPIAPDAMEMQLTRALAAAGATIGAYWLIGKAT